MRAASLLSPEKNEECDDAHPPHVHRAVVARLFPPLALDDFRRNVLPRPADRDHPLHPVRQRSRQAKVGHYGRRVGRLVAQQDILGLEVAVADTGAVKVANGGEQAGDQAAGLVGREGGGTVGEAVGQIATARCGWGRERGWEGGLRGGGEGVGGLNIMTNKTGGRAKVWAEQTRAALYSLPSPPCTAKAALGRNGSRDLLRQRGVAPCLPLVRHSPKSHTRISASSDSYAPYSFTTCWWSSLHITCSSRSRMSRLSW